jgi:hypothetical protein
MPSKPRERGVIGLILASVVALAVALPTFASAGPLPVPAADGQAYFRARAPHHERANPCRRFVRKKRHGRVVCTHRCKKHLKRVRQTYHRMGHVRRRTACIRTHQPASATHDTTITTTVTGENGQQQTVRLRAHLDPTYTRNELDPYEVTYAYSASAAIEGSGGTEEPAALPYGVLQLYNDGVLIPGCSINVGGEVTGGNCLMNYRNNGGLGEHTITTLYISGESSATITEVENIEPLPSSITIDRYEYVFDRNREGESGEESIGHFLITETTAPFAESELFSLGTETGISGWINGDEGKGIFPGTAIYWTPNGEFPPTHLSGWGTKTETKTFEPEVIVSCTEPNPYVTIEPESFHLPWWHFPTLVSGIRPPNLRISEFGDGSHPLTATRHALDGYVEAKTSANIGEFEPC